MTRPDDSNDDMVWFPSSRDADQILAGPLSAQDLPELAAPLADLFSALRRNEATSDPERDRHTIAVIAERVREQRAAAGASRRRVRRIPARAAALAFAAVLASGTAAAAMDGSLPDPVQRMVSKVLERAHVSVPSPDDHAAGARPSAGVTRPARRSERHAVGPTGPAEGTTTTTGSSTTTTSRGPAPPTSNPGSGNRANGSANGKAQGPTGPQGHPPPTHPGPPRGATGHGSGDAKNGANGKSGAAAGTNK